MVEGSLGGGGQVSAPELNSRHSRQRPCHVVCGWASESVLDLRLEPVLDLSFSKTVVASAATAYEALFSRTSRLFISLADDLRRGIH